MNFRFRPLEGNTSRNRFHALAPALLLTAFACSCLLRSGAQAQEIYKWTDADGKVHYGDRAAAPERSKKIAVSPTAPPQPPAVPASSASVQRGAPPHRHVQKQSVPVNPALVRPECKGLIDKIAAVPAGQNWESLSRQFGSACPGIAYECVEYRSSPQNNRCAWVEQSGSNVLIRKSYP